MVQVTMLFLDTQSGCSFWAIGCRSAILLEGIVYKAFVQSLKVNENLLKDFIFKHLIDTILVPYYPLPLEPYPKQTLRMYASHGLCLIRTPSYTGPYDPPSPATLPISLISKSPSNYPQTKSVSIVLFSRPHFVFLHGTSLPFVPPGASVPK